METFFSRDETRRFRRVDIRESLIRDSVSFSEGEKPHLSAFER
jgi:hypothetical protein